MNELFNATADVTFRVEQKKKKRRERLELCGVLLALLVDVCGVQSA